MSRTVPVGQQQAAQREHRADREVRHRPGGADTAIRRRRGSNHASRRVHERVREDRDQLQPRAVDRGARTTPSSARARSRARPTTAKRPSRNTSAAQAELVGDHERRPVAPGDQRRRTTPSPATISAASDDQHRAREEHPAAARGRARSIRAPSPVKTFSRGLNSLRQRLVGASASALRRPRRPRGSRARRGRPAAAPAAPARSRRSAARTSPTSSTSECEPSSSSNSRASLSESRRNVAGCEVLAAPSAARPSDASSRLSA